MNYIFCPSYGSVFFALHLKNLGKEITIITHNISVKKYCIASNINYIYFDYVEIPITKLYKLFVFKSRINNLINQLAIKREDKFYLLDNAIDIPAFYLAKEWSKRGRVYFHNIGRTFHPYTKNKYLNSTFIIMTTYRCLFKIFLGLDLVFLDVHRKPAFGINDKFLKKNKIKKFSSNKNLNELQLEAMIKNHIKLKEYDNLIATDGNFSGIANEVSLIKVYKNLLMHPQKFAVKYHPRVLKTQKLARYEELFVNCDELPDYIPAELLLNNITKNVISIMSTSLSAASQLEHLNAISLLELVDWNNPSYKKEVKTWLIKESNNRIIFVKSFEELNKLLQA